MKRVRAPRRCLPFSIFIFRIKQISIKRLIGANGKMSIVATIAAVANPAGSGSTPVVVTISNLVDAWDNGQLPANGAYAVLVSPPQAGAVSVSNKSTSGFTVTLTPISGAIAAGTIDVLVHQ
jgi:hypothetical protein